MAYIVRDAVTGLHAASVTWGRWRGEPIRSLQLSGAHAAMRIDDYATAEQIRDYWRRMEAHADPVRAAQIEMVRCEEEQA